MKIMIAYINDAKALMKSGFINPLNAVKKIELIIWAIKNKIKATMNTCLELNVSAISPTNENSSSAMIASV